MKKYKLGFDFKIADLFLLLGLCTGFSVIVTFLFSFIGGLFYGISGSIFFLSTFTYLGFAIGGLGSFIFVIKYIIEGIEIYTID